MKKPTRPTRQSGSHVVDDVADYFDRRLGLAREQEIDSHLSACQGCAADYSYAYRLIEASLRSGEIHIRADRMVEVNDNLQAEFTEGEWDHFQKCEDCQRESAQLQLYPAAPDLESLVTGGGSSSAAGRESSSAHHPTGEAAAERLVTERNEGQASAFDPAPTREDITSQWGAEPVVSRGGFVEWLVPKGLLWIAGGAIALLLVILGARFGKDSVASFAQIQPIAVTVPRSTPEPGSFSERWVRGLESYVGGNYAAAEVAFTMAREVDPDHVESALLLGSAHLLQGELTEAVTVLRSANEQAGTAAQKGEACWQLVNALLAANQRADAVKLLEDIAGREGSHQADATAILSLLDSK